MKSFYKSLVTGKWELITDNDQIIFPVASKCRLVSDKKRSYIWIYEGDVKIDDGKITDIAKNADGDKYASLSEFITATSDFFKNTTDTSVLAKLDILNNSINNSGGSTLKSFSVEIIRPANQTPYTAGDVVADTTAAFIPFANVAKAIETGVKIVRVRIQTDDTAVAGTKFNVHLYKDAPTFIADNAAFAVAYANATKRVGAIPVVMGTGNLGTVGMNDYNIAMCNPVARNIYFIIETVTGFTASANSTKFTVTIDCEISNN